MPSGGVVAVASAMVAPGRGILAADEFPRTIEQRFAAVGMPSTPETRRDYRELIFRTTEPMTKYISAVILFDETIRQRAADGTPLVRIIEDAGAIPGIKADVGMKPLALCPGEVVTVGLDDLVERLAAYREMGARFGKWRAVVSVGPGLPTRTAMDVNAHALARYAAVCQEAGLVPIVEPEVLMDGDHDLARCAEVTEEYLERVYDELARARVRLEATVLKPSMVVPGAAGPPRRRTRSPRRRFACSTAPCRPRCPVSRSCPVVSPTRTRPRVSTR